MGRVYCTSGASRYEQPCDLCRMGSVAATVALQDGVEPPEPQVLVTAASSYRASSLCPGALAKDDSRESGFRRLNKPLRFHVEPESMIITRYTGSTYASSPHCHGESERLRYAERHRYNERISLGMDSVQVSQMANRNTMAPSTIGNDLLQELAGGEPERLCQIVTPIGMLGYGFSEPQTEAALQKTAKFSTPTALVLDSGSTDSGPSKLALGSMTCPRAAYVRDLRRLLQLRFKYKVPLLVSSAGGDGSDEHVDEFVDIIREISDEPDNRSWDLKVLAIYSGIPKSLVLEKLEDGKITGCGESVPALTTQDVQQTPRIVAQMGPEPFIDAMAANPDFNVIIGGRAYDPSPYIAFCAYHSLKSKHNNIFTLGSHPLGSFTHMGKIMECGGLCATPKSAGALAYIYKDHSFDITPLDPNARCTPLTVAAHTLYEKSRPDILYGPGGYLDLTNAKYTQLPDKVSVRVRGTTFHFSHADGLPYTVKLEGARVTGFRTLIMGSFRDPILIPQIYSFLDRIKDTMVDHHTHVTESWDVGWHVYGHTPNTKEVFIVGEVLAESQAVATSLASIARVWCAHAAYPGQKATSGNFAMGIGGKMEIETQECTEFSVYHLMPLNEGEEGAMDDARSLFRWKRFEIGKREKGIDSPQPVLNGSSNHAAKIKQIKKPSFQSVASLEPPHTLIDIAKVVRSKNAGPYEITLDVMFDDPKVYQVVKNSGLLGSDVISRLYAVAPENIIWCGFFDVAMAFKATIPRTRAGKGVCSGGFMENDVHGSQQYVPLMELELSDGLIQDLGALKSL
ncbi:hypothetical protein B7494_g7319 [Chlorociboria aeruginascens]|nr:hypothetical protein B7494_g7319 [Chlorociboria aeruginascens]